MKALIKAFNVFNKLELGGRVYDMDDEFIELAKEVTQENKKSMDIYNDMNNFFRENHMDLGTESYLNIVRLTSYLEYTMLSNKHKPSTLKKKMNNGQIKGL